MRWPRDLDWGGQPSVVGLEGQRGGAVVVRDRDREKGRERELKRRAKQSLPYLPTRRRNERGSRPTGDGLAGE